MVYVDYPTKDTTTKCLGGGAINGQITGNDSEDGWFGVAGEFILNDLMWRAGPAKSIEDVDR